MLRLSCHLVELRVMNIHTLSHPQRMAFSPGEFAFAVGLSLSTIHRRLAAGEIKFSRSGRRVLIPREELERLVRPVQSGAPMEAAC
jgi:excisionase family DNA binding protein